MPGNRSDLLHSSRGPHGATGIQEFTQWSQLHGAHGILFPKNIYRKSPVALAPNNQLRRTYTAGIATVNQLKTKIIDFTEAFVDIYILTVSSAADRLIVHDV